MDYADEIEIRPLAKLPVACVRVPGSKSITNRALVLAALCSKNSVVVLRGGLDSEDTQVMIAGLRRLGFAIKVREQGAFLRIASTDPTRLIPAVEADLFVANSGTTMRFLTAMVSLGLGAYRLDGVPRMRQRPIADLLTALGQLGVRGRCLEGNGCPPVVIEGTGWRGGRITIKGDVSSQFLSGLLLAAPFAQADSVIEVEGPLVSAPYVAMTVAMMRHWQLQIDSSRPDCFTVPGKQIPVWAAKENAEFSFAIEPDASAASYFLGAAAISGGEVTVPGLNRHSLQGDVAFAQILARMGCSVDDAGSALTVNGGPLFGIDVDMNAISDTVMTLGAVACFAKGSTTIRNVAHIRHKETDRLAALAAELRRVGAGVDEWPDGLKITPGPLHGARIETYNDHRMAMSMALVGLKVPGIVIKNPGCVAKTYPRFFQDLQGLE